MKAYRFHEWTKGAQWDEVQVPEPGPGEVLIRIGGAGACHSDLHVMHEWTPDFNPQLRRWELPITLGHENAGWIEDGDLGPFEKGQPVVVNASWGCGACSNCLQRFDNYCEGSRMGAGGLGRDGGMAEYLVAPCRSLVPLATLEPWKAAPLTDAGLTSYHAVKHVLAHVPPGTATVVIGVGGLGHMAVEFLRELSGTTIIALDVNERALEMATDRGAHHTLPSDEKAEAGIRKLTGGLGATAVLDFVGIDATLALAAKVVRRRGQLVGVGIGGGVLPFTFGGIPHAVSATYLLGGSTTELAEVVALAEQGRIAPHIQQFRFDQADEVFRRLHDGEIEGRAVLVP